MENLKRLGKIAYFIIGIFAILALNNFFVGQYLRGELTFNDAAFNFHVIEWLNRWFPRFPQWYPLQGTGMSLVRGYPVFAHLTTVLLSKLTPFNLSQSYELVCFLVLFLTALGIYVFTWVKLKNQTIALLASIFYFLSSASSKWLTMVGLYPQVFSLIFVPWILLGFDRYFEKFLKNEQDNARRWWFFLTILSLALAAVSHFITFVVMVETLFLYGALYGLFFPSPWRYKNLSRSFLVVGFIILLAVLLSSSLFLPFIDYRQLANRENLLLPSAEQIGSLPPMVLLGLKGAESYQGKLIANYAFTPSICILSIIGFLLALKKRKIFLTILGVICAFLVLQMNLPDIWPGIIKTLLILFATINIRAIIPLIVSIPILAAFGAWGLAEILLSPILKVLEKIVFLRQALCSFAALVLSFFLIFILRDQLAPGGYDSFYGKYKELTSGNLNFSRFVPSFELAPTIHSLAGYDELRDLSEKLGLSKESRLDITGNFHHFIQAWPLYSEASTVIAYEGYSVINKVMSGYKNSVYYHKENNEFKNFSLVINELAKWFGIDYVLLNKKLDPLERYDSHWQDVEDLDGIVVKKFKEDIPLASWSTKPTILVIGRFDKRSFEQVFRTANLGGISYDQALLVEGKDSGKVDNYTLEELAKFDIIFLYGYTYDNKERAWKLLKDYVQAGGSLFVETGWQYVNPDWQMEQTPEVIPVTKLTWQEFKTWDLPGFSPPSYRGGPWGVSAGENLKGWANAILESGGKILIAKGDFGKGKIVWSGMNLVGHAFTYQNEEELKFLSRLVGFLKETSSQTELAVDFTRDYPDHLEFILGQPTSGMTSLYWREAFFPSWRAYFKKTGSQQLTANLPIYRAGPDLMLVRLPPLKEPTKIILQIDYTLTNFSKLVSLLTFIFLLIYLFQPKIFTKVFERFLSFSKINLVKRWWEKEG